MLIPGAEVGLNAGPQARRPKYPAKTGVGGFGAAKYAGSFRDEFPQVEIQ